MYSVIKGQYDKRVDARLLDSRETTRMEPDRRWREKFIKSTMYPGARILNFYNFLFLQRRASILI